MGDIRAGLEDLKFDGALFAKVKYYVSGEGDPKVSRADSKSLWAMITLQGGKCQLRLDRYCTHLVAAKANGVKYEAATRHHIPVVTPDWITECCKKGTLVNEVEYHPRLLVSPNSSTAMITGFMDEDTDNNVAQEEQDRTKAMLEQLKQRMPWNQPSPPVSSSASHSLGATSTVTVPYSTNGQNTANIQPQPHVSRSVSSTNLSTSTVAPSVSDQDVNQTNWLPQTSQQNNISQQIKTAPSQMQQQELSPQQQQQQQQQQQINMQHQLIQQQQLTSQQQLTQQQLTQHQQQLQQPSYNQQQLLNQQQSPQIQQQQLVGQQQTITPQQQQQSINSQLPQHQLNTQQQQLLTPQQKQLNQHQIIQQQQLQTQQPHLTQQQQQVQLAAQQQQQQQQIVMQQQQQQQQLPSQQQQIAGQHQLTQQQTPPQQLTPEQRQLILLQQQQQQQKIQQISQQLQQSAPQNSQQFVIRDGQLQQQPQNQQLIGPNQQGFIVQRDSQWQQQQYHLQLQRQQQQQQIGPQRSGGQWNQQPPQPPRQLIHLDAQTHQQLQQMDPQQRAQFIQRIQKHRILQRQVQNRPGQQGSHIAVIRSPGKPVQPGNLQWVQQARPQMMGPQLAQTPGQKPVHPGVQPPALAPINSSNQVIVSAGQAVQGPQVSQTGQPFQQGQLIPQQLAQLQLQQKQQQMVRLQQLQHLQQQQQQQGAQQEPSLTSLPNNAQIPPDQQLVVNAKTKTALANMLTNRLQGAAEGSAAGQLRLMTAQHRPPPPPSQDPQLLAAYQRRTLGNITNGAPPGIKMQYAPVMPQPKAQFYGHNPNLKFWKQVIERHGGEVESQYCTRATHVLAITQKHPTVVQALREGKRCVSAHWLSDVVSKQQVIPPWQVLHFPTPFSLTELPCGKHIISLSGFEGEERAKVKIMLEALGAKKHKKPRLDGPLLNKDPHLLGLEEPIVISNPDPPPPDKQPRILFSGINPKNHAKRIRELGGALAASWRDATHLVMSAPLRTDDFARKKEIGESVDASPMG
ncbi:PAX-interacting protein 1 [Temnothorax longispinosus]|uniref:PAX-interacting protein 1 n=1 Tax=Temnothorax longispinosus TaxID=300112 RepID=A0A4V3SBS2_9HYME|nr:PAX-interacting protein 1 [Temnothorax longispinosus]